MPRRPRRGARARPRRRAARAGAARRALPAHPARRLRRAVRRRRALRRGAHAPAPTAACRGADFDACLEFCATGGYALRGLRPLAAAGRARRALAAARPPPGAADPDERRHHRRHRDAGGAAQGPLRRAARRDRGGLRRHAHPRRHLPDRRRDRALREPARDDGRGDARSLRASRRSPSSSAPSSPPRRCSRTGWSALLADPAAWGALPGLHAGLAGAAGARSAACRGPTGCWSRPSRAATARISASTASPAATPTRRSGCSSRGGWRRRGCNPLGFVANDYALMIWGLDGGARPGGAADAGGAARGPRGLARRQRGDEAHLPQRRHRGRADREEPARPAQDRPAGDLLLRHPLRHAAQATTPATCCCASPAPRPGAAWWTSAASRRCWRAVAGRIDFVRAPHVTPLAAPLFLEMGRVPIRAAEARLVTRPRGAAGRGRLRCVKPTGAACARLSRRPAAPENRVTGRTASARVGR